MASHPSAPLSPGLVLFALAMGGFAIGTTEFASMSLLPYFARDLHIDEPTAGHTISAYALGVVLGAPVLAVMAARLPRKTVLLALMVMFAVGNALTALSPSYTWMMIFRFFSGVPHGAYFGVAALVAVSLVPPQKRAQSVARMMLGLSVATIIGVPFANLLGQHFGWRWGFAVVAVLALLTVALVARYAPMDKPRPGASPLRELGALVRGQVWLTLGIGAIGFGGLFAVYTYLASTLMEVTGLSAQQVPLVLSLLGVGLVIGNLAAAWAADRIHMWAAGILLLWSTVALALYPAATGSPWLVTGVVILIGFGGGLGPILQTRLMDVAGDAQTLAAALNHSAFNFANALGPWLAGLAIAAGWGWASSGWVGSLLAFGGFLLWVWAMIVARRKPVVAS
ncbi:MFS transporter [Insolitispirillum peregrinum]|uniref:MFS transporter, DHA1 family, inner membrane transport protein n=1 Tax=Insolitispirillum peregrinum TaxID=80876 RepID=A0A1N7PLR7_9PROT|nr:MFS transporter [Insolitispirillum peregrinum]SIT11319.1 MFS transporter, DHA1 family, inner membrane transport protein [Insolitispirillum peregrinum]